MKGGVEGKRTGQPVTITTKVCASAERNEREGVERAGDRMLSSRLSTYEEWSRLLPEDHLLKNVNFFLMRAFVGTNTLVGGNHSRMNHRIKLASTKRKNYSDIY